MSAQLLQRLALVGQRRHVLGVQRKCHVIAAARSLEIAGLVHCHALLYPDLQVVGVDAERFGVTVCSLPEHFLPVERMPPLLPGEGIVLPQFQRLVVRGHCIPMLVEIGQREAGVHPGVHEFRVDLQGAPEGVHCLLIPVELVQRDPFPDMKAGIVGRQLDYLVVIDHVQLVHVKYPVVAVNGLDVAAKLCQYCAPVGQCGLAGAVYRKGGIILFQSPLQAALHLEVHALVYHSARVAGVEGDGPVQTLQALLLPVQAHQAISYAVV